MIFGKPVVPVSGIRFRVTYLISAHKELAYAMARDICYEQTVEFPEDITPEGDIKDKIVGHIEDFVEAGPGKFRAVISYAVETAGGDLVQLLNVIFGNISIKPGIKVKQLSLPREITSLFKGPRFGTDGLRALFNVSHRPLICTALKPMGLSAAQLAEQAYQFAKGGIDMIKDDHGLANQAFCTFEERLFRCVEAVEKANRETGKACVYMPNVTAPADKIMERVKKAKDAGAGALLISTGLVGIDTMRLIAETDAFGLPVMAHPSFWGSFITSPENGFSHYVLYGQLMRLAGADITVFPNYGGRFSFSREECIEIAEASSEPMGHIKPIFPAPGGGMTTDRAKDMLEVYGREFVLLMGGGLHRHSDDLVENSRYFIRMLESM